MKIGSIIRHVRHGDGKIRYLSEDKVIIDFGKFEITFDPKDADLKLLE